MPPKIRSPIIVVVGHTDHGKTALLDKIRGTTVVNMEPGKITQHTGASYVPVEVVKNIAGNLLEKFKIKIEIPGLLFIDTPGHKAFLGMRKRGGSVSNLAILIVDMTQGFEEQTYESLEVLKEFKTPFVVAATKLDKIRGWFATKDSSFIESFEKQRDDVKTEVDESIYKIISSLSEKGFDAERYDRVENFAKQIAVVPVSNLTGEGIPDLLMTLSGLAQQFLKDKLKISNEARGSVLEVKEVRGLGTTIDVILYDGSVRKGDTIVIGGKEPIVTKVKSLLEPRRLQELRTEKKFESVDEVSAAAGVKISALGLENAIAGSPIIFVKKDSETEKAKREVQREIEEVEFSKNIDGITLKADTLGSLEAMIKILNDEKIPIRKAEVGTVNRQDIIEAQNVKDRLRRTVLSFNVPVPEETSLFAKDLGIKVFSNDVIYRLVEEYQKWVSEEKSKELKEKIASVTHPCEIKVLKGTVFRQSHPAVFGIEVLRGKLRPGALMARDKKKIDRVKGIEKEGKPIEEANRGDKVAVSMENVTVGRQLNEGDILSCMVPEEDMKTLKEIFDKLSEDEKEILREK